MSTTFGEEIQGGRELRCRYTRKSGERCPNPLADLPEGVDPGDREVVLLCPKHLFRAWQQFNAAVPAETLARWKRVFKEAGR